MSKRGSAGAPDVLARLGRPGFPKGLQVLLVGGSGEEREEIGAQMAALGYQVTSCESCHHARRELGSKGAAAFDIVLAEATLVGKECAEGQALLEAAAPLPLVLISSPGTTTECVWRSIEVGAADVLERPLSPLKLQNVWQHVVRKVMETQGASSARGRSGKGEDAPVGQARPSRSCARSRRAKRCAGSANGRQPDLQAASPSRCTPSSSVSAATVARFPDDKPGTEASFSGSQEGKEASLGASMSHSSPEDSHTVDGPSLGSDQVCKPAKRARRSRETRPPPAPRASQPAPAAGPVWGVAPTAAAPGCVWGTPMGWQGMYPSAPAGPLLGSAAAAAAAPIARCHSAPVDKVDALAPAPMDGLEGLDVPLISDLPDDLLLSDDFLDCGDNFLAGLPGAGEPPSAPELPPAISGVDGAAVAAAEKPPIGLRLRKSPSLVDLINRQLAAAAKGQAAA